MNKKIGVLVALLLMFSVAGAFSFGIGLQGGGGVSGGGLGGGAVTFKLDSIPLIFAVSAYGGSNGFVIGGTADYWLDNPTIAGPFGWFYGVGAGATVGGFGDKLIFGANAHVPVGVNVMLLQEKLELYLQAAPGLGIGILPDFGLGFYLDAALGFRYYFK
jgi:hypothetical protein